jgi:hypothetical protein
MRPGTSTCDPDCPTGLVEDAGECNTPADPADLDYCFTWTTKEVN